MLKNKYGSLRKVLDILLSASILIAGICLICACLNIYYSGDGTYTTDIIALNFGYICIPVYICLVLAVVSLIWAFIDRIHGKKPNKSSCKAKNTSMILEALKAKKDPFAAADDLTFSVLAERKFRKRVTLATSVIFAAISVVFLTYALNIDNFHKSEINASMINAMLVLAPCLLVAFISSLISYRLCEKSRQREIELYTKAPIADPFAASCQGSKRRICGLIIRIAILIAAITLILIGLFNNGTADVLTKAINICTECIGLG